MDSDVINFVEEKFKIFKEEMQKSFDINNEIIKENKSHIEHSISQGHQRDIQIQKIDDVIQKLPGGNTIVSPLSGKFTTKEIADGIKNANDIGAGLTSVIRGREGANPAEKAATWFYRNLLLFPKATAQLAKTVLSIPTHLIR